MVAKLIVRRSEAADGMTSREGPSSEAECNVFFHGRSFTFSACGNIECGCGSPVSRPVSPQRVEDCSLPLNEGICTVLLRSHGPMVRAVCRRIFGDAALAEDTAQEVFLLLMRKSHLHCRAKTVLGAWLYLTACHLAQTHHRAQARRALREKRAEAVDYLMTQSQDALWLELSPLLDAAMLGPSQRQRDLVLFHYIQNNSQRAAAALVGCSESVASRELAAALGKLRRFFARRNITVSGAILAALLSAHGAEDSLNATGPAAGGALNHPPTGPAE